MDKYEMFVYCKRDGVTRDAGKHSEIVTDNPQEAKARFMKELTWLYKFYDQVEVTVKKNGEVVKL